MRRVRLPNAGFETTALGFGCSGLLGPNPRAHGRKLLEVAYESGIRHFDVARYYGFGDAEGLVGELLAAHPGELTVTTKFGIDPDTRAARLRPLVDAARWLMRKSAFARKAIRSQTRNVVRRGSFSVEQARAALETSLRMLGVPRVDLWLLHECRPEDCTPELLEFLRGVVAEGKVGQFGTGSAIERTLGVIESAPAFAPVVQFRNNVVERDLDRLGPASAPRDVLTHGPLGGAFGRVRAFLAGDPDRARAWSAAVDADCTDPTVLSCLMLSYAVGANPGGVVLFRSNRPEAIRANARAVAEGTYPPDQVRAFADLVARDLPADAAAPA